MSYKIKVAPGEFESMSYTDACAWKGVKPITKATARRLPANKLPNSRFNIDRWVPVGVTLSDNASSTELTAAYVKAFCGNHYVK